MSNLLKPIHKLRFVESSKVHKKGKIYEIDKYKCVECGKWYFVGKNGKQISFKGGLGEEIE